MFESFFKKTHFNILKIYSYIAYNRKVIFLLVLLPQPVRTSPRASNLAARSAASTCARRADPRTPSTGVPIAGGRAAAPHLGSLQQLDDLGLGVPGRSPARAPPLLLRRRGPRGPGERCRKGH